MGADNDLGDGRKHAEARDWQSAFASLTNADIDMPLGAEDLELLATSAYMLGLDDAYVESLKRAHDALLKRGDVARAVRCAYWIGHNFRHRRQAAQEAGWFARARRLLDDLPADCVERGYLLIPDWLDEMRGGNFEAGRAMANEAERIADRHGDKDLVWMARVEQARALIALGRVDEAIRLVDESLVAATMGELSPIVTGIVYCNTIGFCQAAYQLRRVREWTTALSGWCDAQPEMVAHNGLCLVHRAEVKLLEGNWAAALVDARLSAERFSSGALNQLARGGAFYCQGEAYRLQGDFDLAEEAYRLASRNGCEPQPGLALMRLAQGDTEAAAAAVRRVVAETTDDLRRAGILPAYVEIALAQGDVDRARAACAELNDIQQRHASEVIEARVFFGRGAVALADGRPNEAIQALRGALTIWMELDAPYEIARTRVLLAEACLALADTDSAALEMEAARSIFEMLGAKTDAARAAKMIGADDDKVENLFGLTPRQVEVLRLVAAGKSNHDIAEALFVSKHTVARHLQNVFAKLDVSSRTEATAFAFEHDLV